MRARGARRCTLLVAVNVAPVPYDVAEIDPHPEFDAAEGGTSTFRSAISRCTSTAQRTASTTLPNSAGNPSPVVFTARPRCSLILGSASSPRSAFRRSSVPSSSVPISRESPATSAARIAARRRVWLILAVLCDARRRLRGLDDDYPLAPAQRQ